MARVMRVASPSSLPIFGRISGSIMLSVGRKPWPTGFSPVWGAWKEHQLAEEVSRSDLVWIADFLTCRVGQEMQRQRKEPGHSTSVILGKGNFRHLRNKVLGDDLPHNSLCRCLSLGAVGFHTSGVCCLSTVS